MWQHLAECLKRSFLGERLWQRMAQEVCDVAESHPEEFNPPRPASVAGSSSTGEGDEDDVKFVMCSKASDSQASALDAEAECCAYCERALGTKHMINFGNRNYPRFRCKPCHNSVRLLERAAKAAGEARAEAFSRDRRLHPKAFIDLVLQCRVASENEPPAPREVPSVAKASAGKGENLEKATQLVREMFSCKGVRETDGRMACLTERQFRSYYKVFEDYSAQEAAAKWEKDSQSCEVRQRRDRDGSLMLAVRLPPMAEAFKEFGHKRALLGTSGADDSDDPDEQGAAKRLRSHQDGECQSFVLQHDALQHSSSAEPLAASARSVQTVSKTLLAMAGGSSGDAPAVPQTRKGGCDFVHTPSEAEVAKMGLTKAC